jgi:hypothetical protein
MALGTAKLTPHVGDVLPNDGGVRKGEDGGDEVSAIVPFLERAERVGEIGFSAGRGQDVDLPGGSEFLGEEFGVIGQAAAGGREERGDEKDVFVRHR